ncbi:hypothetical protein [Streptomyces sp. 3211]|uniref:hypothetical protein n=1 Tax=Streptomyces sp. 3211 TaxID=1964449 RepID=UPI0009A482B4|nr:hypothetical protein [Streptomyces sp. 3211]
MVSDLPKRARRVSDLDAAIARRDFHRLGGGDVLLPDWVPAAAAPIRSTVRATPEMLRAVAAGLERRRADEQQQ